MCMGVRNVIRDIYMDHSYSTLQYMKVDGAIRMVLQLGRGAQMVKVDLESTFWMVPVHQDNWELLSMLY